MGDDAATVKAADLLEDLVAQRTVVAACMQLDQAATTWDTVMWPRCRHCSSS